MKSISHMPMHEYDTLVDAVVAICRERREDWGPTVREIAKRTKTTQAMITELADVDDCFTLNVAMQAGGGIYELKGGSQIVEVNEEEYEESLTYRK